MANRTEACLFIAAVEAKVTSKPEAEVVVVGPSSRHVRPPDKIFHGLLGVDPVPFPLTSFVRASDPPGPPGIIDQNSHVCTSGSWSSDLPVELCFIDHERGPHEVHLLLGGYLQQAAPDVVAAHGAVLLAAVGAGLGPRPRHLVIELETGQTHAEPVHPARQAVPAGGAN